MTPLIMAVFMASLLGSLHCAGMCGAFLAFALSEEAGRTTSRTTLQCAYHGGRCVSYAALGATFGAIGAMIDAGGVMIGLQRTAMAIAGIVVLAFGMAALARAAGVRVSHVRVPHAVAAVIGRGHQWALGLPVVWRALTIGLLTGLLPCGWLWAFVATAAGTGSAAVGALTMVIFWMGTLPVLVGLGAGLQRTSGWLAQRMPIATALALIVCGLWTISGRWAIVGAGTSVASAEIGLEEAATHVSTLKHSDAPCCHDD